MIKVKQNYRNGYVVLSPGGRYFAGIESNNTLSVFDLKAGTLAGQVKIAELIPDLPGSYQGMSYSPDGKQLGLVYAYTNSRLVFLDTTTGEVAETVDFAGKPPTASAYKGQAVEWLGAAGWCLFGGPIVDRLAAAYDDVIEPELRDPFDGSLPDLYVTPGQVNVPLIVWMQHRAS